jgi:uncharacterized membrane protein required for colicin V production
MSPIAALPFVFQDGSSAPAASGSPSLALDIACLLIVLVSTWMGARRGSWWEFVRLLGLVATLSVARALAPRLSHGLVGAFESLSPELANGILWSLILVCGLVLVTLVGRMGRLMIDGAELSFLERAGGALLGLGTGLLLTTGLLVCASQIASAGWVERNLRGSHAQELVDGVARIVPAALDPVAAQRASSEVHAAEPESR